jgi:hypothetical protein
MNLSKSKPNTEPNWSTNLPRFCIRCGAGMVEIPKKVEIFDSHTGKHPNRREYYWRCPKIKWWYNFSLHIHDEFLVIEEPDHMIGQYSYRGVLTIMRRGL